MFKELIEKAARALAAAELIRTEMKDVKDWPAEKQTAFDTAMQEYDTLHAQIEAQKKRDAQIKRLEDGKEELLKPVTKPPFVGPEKENASALDKFETQEFKKSWEMLHKASTDEYRKAFRSLMRYGHRGLGPSEWQALQADISVSGGYLMVPQQVVAVLLQGVDDEVFIRKYATKFNVPNADSLGVPYLSADPADADWTSEILTGSEDSTMAFGKRALRPHPLAKAFKISNKLIRTVPNVEALVMGRLAYKFGISMEKTFMTGTGANQPLGLFIASNDGIPTSRDVSTGNTATAITADGLINAKYSLKGQYHRRASTRWIFHRDAVKMIRKLKDGNGQYLWMSGLVGDRPDTILEVPYDMSEYAPNTFETTLYVGLIGDFSFYWIADALDFTVQVVDQLYAATNQTGYFGRLESDGMPVLSEAFARVKLA